MTPSPESCEIRAEDLRDGGLCPLCNHRGIEHAPRLAEILGVVDIAAESPRWRWHATNRRTQIGLGNTSLAGALRFAVDNLLSGHGLTRIGRTAR